MVAPGGSQGGGKAGDTGVLGTLTQILGYVRATSAKYDQQATVFNTLAHVLTTAANVYTEQARQSAPAPAAQAQPATAAAPPATTIGGGPGGGFGILAGALGVVAKAVGAATAATLVLPRAVMAAERAILGLGQSMLGMVAKANPAAAQRWELAVSDLLATLGAALAPVLELVTGVVRTMADAFTLLIPVGAELAGALKPVFDLIGEALAGAIGYLASALKAVVPVLGVVVRMFVDLVGWLGKLLKEGLALLGIDLTPEQAKKGAAVGMAARPAQIGAVDEVLKTAMRASFSVGLGGGDPAAKTASEAKRIRELTDYIYAEVKALPDRIGAFLQDLPGNIARAIARGLPDSQDAVANTFAAAAAAGGGNATIAGAVAQQMNTLRLLDLSPATGLAGQMSPW